MGVCLSGMHIYIYLDGFSFHVHMLFYVTIYSSLAKKTFKKHAANIKLKFISEVVTHY